MHTLSFGELESVTGGSVTTGTTTGTSASSGGVSGSKGTGGSGGPQTVAGGKTNFGGAGSTISKNNLGNPYTHSSPPCGPNGLSANGGICI